MKQEEQYQAKMTMHSFLKNNSKIELIKWGACPAAGVLLVVLSVLWLKGDAFVFWTWWLLALLLGMAFMPFSSLLFGRFEDKGWFFSKALAIAFCGFTEWFLVATGLMVFNTATCVLVCILYTAGMLFLAKIRQKKSVSILPWNHFRLIIYGELIFAAVFLIWTFLAGMRPEAYGTEKFMDYGFMEAMMRSRTPGYRHVVFGRHAQLLLRRAVLCGVSAKAVRQPCGSHIQSDANLCRRVFVHSALFSGVSDDAG